MPKNPRKLAPGRSCYGSILTVSGDDLDRVHAAHKLANVVMRTVLKHGLSNAHLFVYRQDGNVLGRSLISMHVNPNPGCLGRLRRQLRCVLLAPSAMEQPGFTMVVSLEGRPCKKLEDPKYTGTVYGFEQACKSKEA